MGVVSGRARWPQFLFLFCIHCKFISQKVYVKSFCRSQFPHKSVNLSFTSVIVKDKLTADRLDRRGVSGRARWAEILFLFYMHCEWCSIIMVLYNQRRIPFV